MSDGSVFLGFATLIAVGVCLNGWRFARMKHNPFAGRKLLGMDVEGHAMSVKQLNLLGCVQMVAAPAFLVLFACMAFGLLGPVNGITTIKL